MHITGHITYETRRVVVTGCLSITVGLQDWIGRDNLVLQTWFVWVLYLALLFANASSNKSKVLNNLLGVFSLTGTRLTTID